MENRSVPITPSDLKNLIQVQFFDSMSFTNENVNTIYKKGLDIIKTTLDKISTERDLEKDYFFSYKLGSSFAEDKITFQISLFHAIKSNKVNIDYKCFLHIYKRIPTIGSNINDFKKGLFELENFKTNLRSYLHKAFCFFGESAVKIRKDKLFIK